MSQVRYKYANVADAGTVLFYGSQEPNLPATNVQSEILGKIWRTLETFKVTTHNQDIPFKDSATTDLTVYTIPSGTYTGSGLASVIVTGLDAEGIYSDHEAAYNGTSKIFTIGRTSTTTGAFQMLFTSGAYSGTTIATMCGYPRTDQTGASEYTSTATLGNENELVVTLAATSTCDALIVDKHNWGSSTVSLFRTSKEDGAVFQGWKQTASINRSASLTWNATRIVSDFTATMVKSFQLIWYDWNVRPYGEIGRIFLGKYFEPNNQVDNIIDYRQKKLDFRSRQTLAESGITHFDKRDTLIEWQVPVPPLNVFYDSATKSGFETMLDDIGNDTVMYVTFQSSDPNGSTVYGFLRADIAYTRLKSTPTFQIKSLRLREQK